MEKVTIIWFSKSKNTFKKLYLKKSTCYFLIGILSIFFISYLVFGGYILYQHNYLNKAKKKIATLDSDLKQLLKVQQALKQKEKKVKELNQKLAKAREDLKKMYEMEIKIKKFLGLDQEKIKNDNFSHQGGFQFSKFLNKNITEYSEIDEIESLNFTVDILNYSSKIKEVMEELTDILQQRHEILSQIPSILPVKGDKLWISCGFGWRINPFTQKKEFHDALDIAGPWKTPIIAPADGVVVKVSHNWIAGNYIEIKHTDQIRTKFCHLYKPTVKKGQKVKRGDVIGYMGNTGVSTGTHLHYKITVNGKSVNPIYYIFDSRLANLTLR